MAFRSGATAAAKSAGNPFAHLSLAQRKDLCYEVLSEVGARNIDERGSEIFHSCLLPFGNHSHGDNNPSASLNYEKMVAGCFVCGGGGWLWWLAAVQGLESSSEARDWVTKKAGAARVDTLSDLLAYLDNLTVQEIVADQPPPVYDPSTLDKWMLVHPYLTEMRGVPLENILALKVGYGTLRMKVGENQWVDSERIVIPHFFDDKLYGWQSRRLRKSDGTPKYSSTPDMPKDRTLFHYERGVESLVVVESPMTVIRHTHHAHLAGTFGANVTDRQRDLIAKSRADRAILWFDNDTAGWNATEQVGEWLMSRGVVYAAQSPYSGDPGDLTDEQFEEVLRDYIVPFALWRRPTEEELVDHEEVRNVGEGAVQ